MTDETWTSSTISRARTLRRRAAWVMLTLALLANACGADERDSADTEPTTAVDVDARQSPGCEMSAEPTSTSGNFETRDLVVDGALRTYLVYVPTTLHHERPAPLVLNHHGFTQSAGQQRILSGFDELAEAEGIVVAYPDAGDRSWNFEDDSDVAYIEALIDDVGETTCIDEERIYAIGMSQGGGFSTLLACRIPDRIAGVASVAVLHHHDGRSCENPAAAPVLTVVGTADAIYSIEEGVTLEVDSLDPPGPLAAETADWAETNRCDPDPIETTLDRGVVRRDFSCADGADLAVIVHQGGHIWPGPIHGLDTNRLAWDFLSDHPET